MNSVIKSKEIQNKARYLMAKQREKIKNYKKLLNVLAFDWRGDKIN